MTLRINRQATSLSVSANISNFSIFNKLWLIAQGSGTLFTRGTEVNFDNLCVGEISGGGGGGGGIGNSCTSTLDSNMVLNVPIMKYKDALLGEMYLWVNLQYQLNPSLILFKLLNYGMLSATDAQKYNCAMSTIGSDLSMRLSDLNLPPNSYWVNLKFEPNMSKGSDLFFYASNFGLNQGSIAGSEHVTLQSPPDSANNQSLTPTLRWSATGSPTAFRVYMARDINTLLGVDISGTTCSGCVVNERVTGSTSYTIPSGSLQAGNTYYWMVKAAYNSGIIASPIWSFVAGSGGGGGGTSTNIGPSGGTINRDNAVIVIPPNTFDKDTAINISKVTTSQPPTNYPDATNVSDVYTIEIDGDVKQHITIQLPLNSAVDASEEVMAVLEIDDYYNMFAPQPQSMGLMLPASSVGGNIYSVMLPASVRGGGKASQISEAKTLKTSTRRIKFKVRLVRGYVQLVSDHFKLSYPKRSCNYSVVKEYLLYAELAYKKLITDMGFSASGLWLPMPINITKLEPDRYGEMGYGSLGRWILGNWSIYLNLNQSFCNSTDPKDLKEMKVTIGHEFFHAIQATYDPYWAQRESSFGSPHYWFQEASSVWFENYMLNDPDYVSSALDSSNAKFYKNGLESGGQADPQSHGYGASRFLRYLTLKDNSRKDIIKRAWEIIFNDNPWSTQAIGRAFSSYGDFKDTWQDFAEKYIMGKTGFNGFSGQDFDAYFGYDDKAPSKTFDLSLNPYSAFNIDLRFIKLPNDATYKIEFSGVKVPSVIGAPEIIRAKLFDGATTNEIAKVPTIATTPFTFTAKKGAKYNLVVVNTDDVTGGVSNIKVTVAPALYIDSISPTKGPVGTAVTIKGGGFGKQGDTRQVTFNGVKATDVTWKSETEAVAKVPQNASTGDVVVEVNGLKSNGVNFEVIAQCNAQQVAGGDTPDTRTIELGKNEGTIAFSYETYRIKDRIIVTYEGKVLHDSGCVGTGGTKTVNLTYKGQSTQIQVRVEPNCAGESGTAWNYTVNCP